MKRFIFLLFIPFLSFGQKVDTTTTTSNIPKWTAMFDVVNYINIRPALLFSAEYQINDFLSIHQEFGPVIFFEGNRSNIDYSQLFGLKERTELKYYYFRKTIKQKWFLQHVSKFIAFDIQYNHHQALAYYWADVFDDRSVYRLTQEKVVYRQVFFHFRHGWTYWLRDKMFLSISVGIGNKIYSKRQASEFYEKAVDNNSSDTFRPPDSNLHINMRMKIGFVIK